MSHRRFFIFSEKSVLTQLSRMRERDLRYLFLLTYKKHKAGTTGKLCHPNKKKKERENISELKLQLQLVQVVVVFCMRCKSKSNVHVIFFCCCTTNVMYKRRPETFCPYTVTYITYANVLQSTRLQF